MYRARRRTSFHGGLPELKLDTRPLLTDPVVLHEHLGRIRDGIERDPAAAIASCKELVESLLKMILDKSTVEYTKNDNIPKLYTQVAALPALKAESVPASAKGSEASHKVLGTLAQTVNSLAELRNQLGLGHGRTTPSPALARHPRLALNATVTVAEFLLDTWHERVDKGLLTPTP
ncbi:abortive infection family protein [Embleya sp. NBC_00896]|uniref:abortive infection family protein n=1 Tax=Embleya sp. NBC_00896 TaxID=2975961 RepID=UPI002F911777|nr:abortive infection family protein [Embleya sp. NBC_00896]